MAWTGIGRLTAGPVSAGNLGFSLPPGTEAGDLLVVYIGWRNATSSFSVPTGWELINSYVSGSNNTVGAGGIPCVMMAWAIYEPGVTGGVFTRSGGDVAYGVIAAYRSSTGLPPSYGGFSTGIRNLSGYSTVAAGSIANPDNALLAVGAAIGAYSYTFSYLSSSGMTNAGSSARSDYSAYPVVDDAWFERVDASTTTGFDIRIGYWDGVKTPSGTTGSITAGYSANSLGKIIAAMFYENHPPTIEADLSATEDVDAAVFATNPVISSALVTIEGADTAAFVASPVVSSSFSLTEGADIADFEGSPVISGELEATEGSDTAEFEAIIGTPSIEAELSAIEGADTASFNTNTGEPDFSENLSARERRLRRALIAQRGKKPSLKEPIVAPVQKEPRRKLTREEARAAIKAPTTCPKSDTPELRGERTPEPMGLIWQEPEFSLASAEDIERDNAEIILYLTEVMGIELIE